MVRRLGALSIAATLLLLAGCSSNDNPASSNNSANRTVKADPSFAADIQEIFNRTGCTASNCHGSLKQSNLDLRPDSSYINLVNVDVFETSGKRVIPGDAQNSYIVIKVEGRQAVGVQMPSGLPPLDSIDVANLRNWIDQGAKDN